jgi:hypothetical protein
MSEFPTFFHNYTTFFSVFQRFAGDGKNNYLGFCGNSSFAGPRGPRFRIGVLEIAARCRTSSTATRFPFP